MAARTAERLGASLVLFHAVPGNRMDEGADISPSSDADQLRLEANKFLRELAEDADPGVPWEIMVEAGEPVDLILQTADHLQAAGIFMAAHACPSWLRWLHRNTARQVLRRAPCPVWILSPGQEEKQAVLLVVDRVPLTFQHARPVLPARSAEAFLSWCA